MLPIGSDVVERIKVTVQYLVGCVNPFATGICSFFSNPRNLCPCEPFHTLLQRGVKSCQKEGLISQGEAKKYP